MSQEPLNITADHVARLVMLTWGKMSNGKPFWCFVSVKPSRHDELQKRVATKTFDIRTYEQDGFGEFVVSGEGLMPPNDVIKTVSTMFNVPIRQMFSQVDVDAVITKEIERVKKELGEG